MITNRCFFRSNISEVTDSSDPKQSNNFSGPENPTFRKIGNAANAKFYSKYFQCTLCDFTSLHCQSFKRHCIRTHKTALIEAIIKDEEDPENNIFNYIKVKDMSKSEKCYICQCCKESFNEEEAVKDHVFSSHSQDDRMIVKTCSFFEVKTMNK